MSLAFRNPMTIAEFLAWEDRQPLRYEFDGLQVIAMTGGTAAHSLLQSNLAVSLVTRLRGKKCRFYNSDLKIEVDGRIRYPDGFVVCSPVPPRSKVVSDPVVIFEVLSESTGSIDMVVKNREYAATPSVQRYVILSQTQMGGTMFERVGEDWVGHILDADSLVSMPEIGIEVPLREFYEGVELVPEDDTPSALVR